MIVYGGRVEIEKVCEDGNATPSCDPPKMRMDDDAFRYAELCPNLFIALLSEGLHLSHVLFLNE